MVERLSNLLNQYSHILEDYVCLGHYTGLARTKTSSCKQERSSCSVWLNRQKYGIVKSLAQFFLNTWSWKQGKVVAWNLTYVNRLAMSHQRLATNEGPAIASEAEKRTRSHYPDRPDHVIFELVAMECRGGIGDSSLKFIREVSRRIAENTNEKRSNYFVRQRLSLQVQRGSAACLTEATHQVF